MFTVGVKQQNNNNNTLYELNPLEREATTKKSKVAATESESVFLKDLFFLHWGY